MALTSKERVRLALEEVLGALPARDAAQQAAAPATDRPSNALRSVTVA